MVTQSPLESEIATLMVDVLNLPDVKPGEIDAQASLIRGDFALDSIDVLELSLALSKKYSIKLESEDNDLGDAFDNLQKLAALVESLRIG